MPQPCLDALAPDDATLLAFREGKLGEETAIQVMKHLTSCATCRKRTMIVDTSVDAFGDETPGTATVADRPRAVEVLPRGAMVDRYVLLELLGQGGMGRVYAAYDPQLNRKVALKLLRAEGRPSASSSKGQDRLLREAQAMAQLSHPNVVAIYDVGVHGDHIFLAMELVEGSTLKRWLEAPRPWRERLAVLVAAGRGLAAAHAAGLVHRDFKPENVLIGNDGRVRVTDFGIAHLERQPEKLDASATSATPLASTGDPSDSSPHEMAATRAGLVLGTVGYMAPEQAKGDPTDARCDQFSFCVSLYAALFGQRPFNGRTMPDYLDSLARRAIEPPKDSPVPSRLRRIVLRGLSENPAQRFASMQELLAALERDPFVAWRRRLTAASVTLVVVLTLGMLYQTRQRQSRLCAGSAQRLTSVWGPGVKKGVESAFLATGKPSAAYAWSRVESVLDDYALAWTSADANACIAARIRGDMPEELYQRQTTCLERLRVELGSLTSLFSRADAQVLENAITAAYSLTPPSRCVDMKALRAALTLPADPVKRERVLAVRPQLASSRFLFEAGKYKEGIAQLETLLVQVRALAFRPIEAETLLLLGRNQEGADDATAADASYRQALYMAYAAGHDEVVARAAARLAYLAYTRVRLTEGQDWVALGTAALERLGGGNEELEAEVIHARAALTLEAGEPVRALGLYLRSFDLRKQVLGPEHPETARSLSALSYVHYKLGELGPAQEYVAQAVSLLEKALGPEHPRLLIPLHNQGHYLMMLGRYDVAAARLARAVALAKRLNPRGARAGNALSDVGRLQQLTGQYDEAIATLRQAIDILEKLDGPDNPHLADSLVTLGNALLAKGKAPEALAHCKRAVALQEKAGLKLADFYDTDALTCLGESLLALNRGSAALEALERGVTFTRRPPGHLGRARFALARALEATQRDAARARALVEQARQEWAPLAHFRAELAKAERWLASHPGSQADPNGFTTRTRP